MIFRLYTEHGALNSKRVFDAFAAGLKNTNHSVTETGVGDIAVIWSVLWCGRMLPNKQIYNDYISKGKPVVILEVGVLARNITWRIALNTLDNLIYSETSKLCIDQTLWRDTGTNILICGQNEQSQLWEDMPPMRHWVSSIIEQVRLRSDRPIIVRPHPRSSLKLFNHLDYKNVTIQVPRRILGSYDSFDLSFVDVHTVINHSSGPGVLAALYGTPVITSPQSLAYPMSKNIDDIESPTTIDREFWLRSVACSEHTLDEISNGSFLMHLTSKLQML